MSNTNIHNIMLTTMPEIQLVDVKFKGSSDRTYTYCYNHKEMTIGTGDIIIVPVNTESKSVDFVLSDDSKKNAKLHHTELVEVVRVYDAFDLHPRHETAESRNINFVIAVVSREQYKNYHEKTVDLAENIRTLRRQQVHQRRQAVYDQLGIDAGAAKALTYGDRGGTQVLSQIVKDLDTLGLPTVVKNILTKHGIVNITMLTNHSRTQLMSIKGLGGKTLELIEKKLKINSLNLKAE